LLHCTSSGGRSLSEGENIWLYPPVYRLLQIWLVVLEYAQIVASPCENGIDNGLAEQTRIRCDQPALERYPLQQLHGCCDQITVADSPLADTTFNSWPAAVSTCKAGCSGFVRRLPRNTLPSILIALTRSLTNSRSTPAASRPEPRQARRPPCTTRWRILTDQDCPQSPRDALCSPSACALTSTCPAGASPRAARPRTASQVFLAEDTAAHADCADHVACRTRPTSRPATCFRPLLPSTLPRPCLKHTPFTPSRNFDKP